MVLNALDRGRVPFQVAKKIILDPSAGSRDCP